MAKYHCTLAKTWNPDKQNVTGWYWSEKLDGVRALWKPELGCFMSRSDKSLNVPPSWLKMMSKVTLPLDGEFFMGRGRFSETVSAVRKKEPTEADFEGVRYSVFDHVPIPYNGGCFDERINRCGQATLQLGDPRVHTLQHRIVGCMCDMAVEYDRIISCGGEGIMFRNPHMKYEFKRSGNLLKWKSSIDGRAVIDDIQPGEGKHEGRMGALVCTDYPDSPPKDGLIRFKIGTGFTDSQREQEWRVGEVIRWRAMERTRDGVPRFPVFICIDEGD